MLSPSGTDTAHARRCPSDTGRAFSGDLLRKSAVQGLKRQRTLPGSVACRYQYPAETARRLSCDASLMTVLEDEKGNVLNIGRRARTVPASIRRALDLRDKTCRFPGCSESRNVESHHIEHWADGGATSLTNLLKMCRFHHAQLHRGCYEVRVEVPVEGKSEPQLVFSTPSGRQIETDYFPQFPEESEDKAGDALRTDAPAVDADTCTPNWQGEHCDYGMAVEAMLKKEASATVANSHAYDA